MTQKKLTLSAHVTWKKKLSKHSLEPQPYWGFDDLFHKVGSKLHNCFFVIADSKNIDGKMHFHYQDIYILKTLDKEKFVDAVENGNLYIDFDARTGHNHGTKFRLKSNILVKLYTETKQY